jgi:hypothetical protein
MIPKTPIINEQVPSDIREFLSADREQRIT